MTVLLDTNIIVHREAARAVNESIGDLYRLMERYDIEKRIHPVTVEEISRLRDENTRRSMLIKVSSYEVLATTSPLGDELRSLSDRLDSDPNSRNDSLILNEVYSGHCDALITEDRGIHTKARELAISEKVFTIDSFLERLVAEHPDLVEYRVPSVTKAHFGEVELEDEFFDSFRTDYQGFDIWFKRKSDEVAYVSRSDGRILAFLYVKVETETEPYNDIRPPFTPAKRMKIGTFKVAQNGYKIGERFLKIIFDNAIRQRSSEIYVTIFRRTIDHERLIFLLQDFGFRLHGYKHSASGEEEVYVRALSAPADPSAPKLSFPFICSSTRRFIVPIYGNYHTSLFPDSILNNESPDTFVEHHPHRNAIRKVYVSRSYFRDLQPGDAVVFYRTGGYYRGVVTTLGIVERVYDNLATLEEFRERCRKRSVFTDTELEEQWNWRPNNRPFVVQFLYAFSFPKRPNLKRLIELGVVRSVADAPRGFEQISEAQFQSILSEANLDASIVIH